MYQFAGVAADRGFTFGIDWVEGRRVRCYVNSSVCASNWRIRTASRQLVARSMVKHGGLWGSQFVVIAVIRGGRKGVDSVRHGLIAYGIPFWGTAVLVVRRRSSL